MIRLSFYRGLFVAAVSAATTVSAAYLKAEDVDADGLQLAQTDSFLDLYSSLSTMDQSEIAADDSDKEEEN